MWKGSIANAADNLETTLDDRQAFRVFVVNKTGNIFSRHFRELFLKKCFESGQEDERFCLHVVFYWNDLYYAFPEFKDGRLFCSYGLTKVDQG